MKTSVDISDAIFKRVQRIVRKDRLTLRQLIEEGLTKVLAEREGKKKPFKLRDATVSGSGLSDAYKDAGWDTIREAIYSSETASEDTDAGD